MAINGIAIKVLKKNEKKEEKDEEIGDGREKHVRDNAIMIPESLCDKLLSLSVVIRRFGNLCPTGAARLAS